MKEKFVTNNNYGYLLDDSTGFERGLEIYNNEKSLVKKDNIPFISVKPPRLTPYGAEDGASIKMEYARYIRINKVI